MAANDFNAAVGGAFGGNRQLEDCLSHVGNRHRRRGHGNEDTQEDGAVVIVVAEGRRVGTRGMGVSTPMAMYSPAVVMRRRVIVRMRVYERSAQDRGLNRH